MATLIDDCKTARADLERARLANQTRQQMATLQSRDAQWSAQLKAWSSVRQQLEVFALRIGDLKNVQNAAVAAAALAKEAGTRLATEADLQALSADNLWTRLIAQAESANEAAKAAVNEAWKDFLAEIPPFDPPAALEQRVPPTPGNARAVEKYRIHHQTLGGLTRSAPARSQDVLERIRETVKQMQEVLSSLTVHASDEVKKFLAAAQGSGAALEMLTPEVKAWLAQYDQPDRFVIRTRRSGL